MSKVFVRKPIINCIGQTQEQIDNHEVVQDGAQPGDLIFVDLILSCPPSPPRAAYSDAAAERRAAGGAHHRRRHLGRRVPQPCAGCRRRGLLVRGWRPRPARARRRVERSQAEADRGAALGPRRCRRGGYVSSPRALGERVWLRPCDAGARAETENNTRRRPRREVSG